MQIWMKMYLAVNIITRLLKNKSAGLHMCVGDLNDNRCAFEHHVRSAFNLSGVSDFTFYALQTENTANATV